MMWRYPANLINIPIFRDCKGAVAYRIFQLFYQLFLLVPL